jgi:hypothetical protein
LNTYAMQKIAADYGVQTRSVAATTTQARQARRDRHAQPLHDVAAGSGGRRGWLAGPVPRPREAEETVTRRAA